MTRRTNQQNRALHLWIKQIAEAMAAAGFDMRTTVKIPITPTPENVKETIVRPVMQALFPHITSTTELSKTDVSRLYEVVDQALNEKLGIDIPFPSDEEVMFRSRKNGTRRRI